MTESLFGLRSTGLWTNRPSAWDSEPLTIERLRDAMAQMDAIGRAPPEPEVFWVPHATWLRMEAVKREFPRASDWQCLGAATWAVDDADAVAMFARWYVR